MSETDSEYAEDDCCPHFGAPICEDGETCCRCIRKTEIWNKAFSGHGPISQAGEVDKS